VGLEGEGVEVGGHKRGWGGCKNKMIRHEYETYKLSSFFMILLSPDD